MMVDLDQIPPGRFRLIQLETGEILDLSDPALGRPDGLELWDAAASKTSPRAAPTARCLFPECVRLGMTSLYLKVIKETGTRVAAHHPGEGGRPHRVATPENKDHGALLDVWDGVVRGAGYSTRIERGQDGGKLFPDLLVSGGDVQVSIEVQLTPKKDHIRRTRDAAERGITAVWNSGPRVNLKDRVPELRFTTTIPEVLLTRQPRDLRLLGVRNLQKVRNVGKAGFRFQPSPAPMLMGDIAECLPVGDLVPVPYGKMQILIARSQVDDYLSDGPVPPTAERERPAPPPLGEAQRHADLARRRAGFSRSVPVLDLDPAEEPYFAHGTGDLATLVPCVLCGVETFRRRWDMAIHAGCESHLGARS
jgi:hypothetical protein